MRVSRRSTVVIAAATLSLAALAACGGKQGGFPGGGAMPVTIVTLKPTTVTLTRELPGRTSAFLVADVRPQANGVIKRRLFTEGGLVRAGETLYELDDRIYRAQYDSAVAAQTKAEATLKSAKFAAERSA